MRLMVLINRCMGALDGGKAVGRERMKNGCRMFENRPK